MREIEVKARVSDAPALLGRLKENNILLSEPITHRDRVFGLAGLAGGEHSTAPWLRIRTETKNGKTTQLFTLKKAVTNQLDSIEHETEIVDAAELEKIILQLGFAPYSDLTKTRQKAQVGDIELCFDTVDGLGVFIEAEKLTTEDVDYDEVAGELWQLLEKQGITREDEVTDGYDVLMRRANRVDG